jgi:hypothetical protein
MKIDKDLVIDEIRKQGQSPHVQQALDELPAKVDHEQHAAMLEKFGLDPGQAGRTRSEGRDFEALVCRG